MERVAELQIEPKGYKLDNDSLFAVAQAFLCSGLPNPAKALRELQRLRTDVPGLAMEALPHRFTQIQQESAPLICGVHGPLDGNFRSALTEVLAGAPKDLKARVVTAGVLLYVGAETGPFSFFYHGRQIAQKLGVYYNLHPNVLKVLAGKGKLPPLSADLYLLILIENGWFDPHLSLSYDPKALKDFIEKYGLGFTLDTSHALQAAATSNRASGAYLRSLWELGPVVVHLSDRSDEGGDHYPVGMGNHTGLLHELKQEMKKKPGLMVILEIEPHLHHLSREKAIKDTLAFLS